MANSFNMMTACVWYKKNFLHMTLLVVAVALLLLLMLLSLSCICCRCCCWCGYFVDIIVVVVVVLSLWRGCQHLLHQLRLHVGRGLLAAKLIPPLLIENTGPAGKDNDRVILEQIHQSNYIASYKIIDSFGNIFQNIFVSLKI